MAYACVLYCKDDVQKNVPVSFIQNFNPSKYDNRIRYWIFWSNKCDDSPDKMLEKVDKIPHIEDEDASEEAGYYRATVLQVAESLSALEKLASEKRPRIASAKTLRNVSFEAAAQPQPTRTRQAGKRQTSQHVQGKKIKQEEINDKTKSVSRSENLKRAHAFNLRNLSSISQSRSVLDQSIKQVIAPIDHTRSTKQSSTLQANISKKVAAVIDKKNKTVKNEIKNDLDTDSVNSSTSDSDSDSSEGRDAGPTYLAPKEVIALKDEISALQSNNKRYLDLNLSLQERLISVQQEVVEKNNSIDRLKAENQELQAKLSSASNHSAVSHTRDSPTVRVVAPAPSPLAAVLSVSPTNHLSAGSGIEETSIFSAIFDDDLRNTCASTSSKLVEDVDSVDGGFEITCMSLDDTENGNMSNQRVKKGLVINTAKVDVDSDKGDKPSIVSPSTAVQNCKVKAYSVHPAVDEANQAMSTAVDAGQENFEYCPGKSLPLKDWKEFLVIHSGPAKDSIFTKKMAVKIFSSEVLRESKVKGIKRGKGGSNEKEAVGRPGLDKGLWQCLRNCLIKKLKHEGIADPESHQRTSPETLNQFLKDKIKVLRRVKDN